MDGIAEMKDNQFELAIVDVPYGINVNVSMGRRRKDQKSLYHRFSGSDTKSPDLFYFQELIRVSKNQIIWGANHFIEKIPNANTKSWIVWDKKFSNDVSFAAAELAWTSFDKVIKLYSRSSADKNRIHPTEKPADLYKWLLQNYAKEGDKILDTHLGSGSIAIACHDLKFDLVGYELDKEYYDSACDRLAKHRSQGLLF